MGAQELVGLSRDAMAPFEKHMRTTAKLGAMNFLSVHFALEYQPEHSSHCVVGLWTPTRPKLQGARRQERSEKETQRGRESERLSE